VFRLRLSIDSLKVKLKGLIDVGSGRPKRLTINKCSICAYVMPPSAPHCSNAFLSRFREIHEKPGVAASVDSHLASFQMVKAVQNAPGTHFNVCNKCS